MKKYITLTALTLALIIAVIPFAQKVEAALTASQVNAVVSLLQAFGADSNTVANVRASLRGETPPRHNDPPQDNQVCLTLNNNLYLGARDSTTGGEVTALQKFLTSESDVYGGGEITGYFGPATERAVKRWQAKHGVVSGGTPNTTGYGVVGPKTRAKMKSLSCGEAGVSSPTISLNKTSGIVGTFVTVNGGGFINNNNSVARLYFDGRAVRIISTTASDGYGNLSFTFKVPSVEPGVYQVRAINGDKEGNAVNFNVLDRDTATSSITVFSPNGGKYGKQEKRIELNGVK